MFYFFLISLYSVSLATSERSDAIWNNPAGLSFHSGIELMLSSDSSLTFTFKRISYGLKLKGDSLDYITGGNYFTYKNVFSLGYAYSSLSRKNILGIMYRPFSFLSIGAIKELPSEKYLTGKIGIAIKPFSNRITLYSDAGVNSSGKFAIGKIGGDIEPLDGICLSLESGIKEKSLKIGLHIAFSGNFRFDAKYDTNLKRTDTRVILSYEPYPSLYKPRNRVVHLTIEGDYPESPERTGFLGLSRKPTFYNLIQKVSAIENDNAVKTLVVYLKENSLSYAQIEELRTVIDEIHKKKEVIFFANTYSLKTLYLASAGTRIILPPSGEVFTPGIFLVREFLKGTLDKLGMEAQFGRVGKYKSAVETFTRKHISTPDSIQYQKILDTIVDVILSGISKGRGIPEDSLTKLVNNIGIFNDSSALASGIIDTVMYQDEVEKLYGIGKFSLPTKPISRSFREDLKPKIAYIALEGDIVTGKSGNSPFSIPLLGGKTMGDETVRKMLKSIREDKSIKSVVIRVNSPGGDALASDLIWREMKLLKDKKPVVVSMGGAAASGGYYISAPATRIFADKMTLTGSIGIFGGKLVMKKFFEKIGISYDVLKWGKHSDAQLSFRPYTDEEMEGLNRHLNYFYRKFTRKVSSGRKILQDSVNTIGQGRVWSGADGKYVGLVDKNGGILDALNEAKALAGLKNYTVKVYGKGGGIFGTKDLSASLQILEMLEKPYLYFCPVKISE